MGARRKYKWDIWFGQPRTVLTRGVDYQCSQATMAQTVRNNASQRGLRVSVTDTGDSIVIEIVGEQEWASEWEKRRASSPP